MEQIYLGKSVLSMDGRSLFKTERAAVYDRSSSNTRAYSTNQSALSTPTTRPYPNDQQADQSGKAPLYYGRRETQSTKSQA